jgi:5-methylcytosine-specific restriction endonuclease McrA
MAPHAKTCSACQDRRREKNPRWNPALTDEARSCERSKQPEYIVWRKAILARDGFACRECGARGYLHAHHLAGFMDRPDLRFDLENGITLCRKCHGAIHGKDFEARRPRFCPACGKQTSGRGVGGRCQSCAARARGRATA